MIRLTDCLLECSTFSPILLRKFAINCVDVAIQQYLLESFFTSWT